MSEKTAKLSPPWRQPVLVLLGVVICLGMLRLGVWQLDRADQKQAIVDERQERADATIIDLIDLPELTATQNRFRPVRVTGKYLPNKTIYLDNQTFKQQVGYQILTPMQLDGSERLILIARGWIETGPNRNRLPDLITPVDTLTITGRLNTPIGPPPLWNDEYPVHSGARWQYLDLIMAQTQIGQELYPLVLELSPEFDGDRYLKRAWQGIDDREVNKHKAYAFQWFAMSLAFFIACVFLLRASNKKS